MGEFLVIWLCRLACRIKLGEELPKKYLSKYNNEAVVRRARKSPSPCNLLPAPTPLHPPTHKRVPRALNTSTTCILSLARNIIDICKNLGSEEALVEAALDNVTGSWSCPRVTLIFSSVQRCSIQWGSKHVWECNLFQCWPPLHVQTHKNFCCCIFSMLLEKSHYNSTK